MWLNYAGLGVSSHIGHVSPAYRSYWIGRDVDRRFIHHLMRSSIYVQGYTQLLTGIRPNSLQMSRDDLMAFPVLLAPKSEQTQIARFLDHETAKIDALICEQERLIELLQEKRQAVISHAVTKGLDPDVPMKDSGVEWLGEVPAHWRVVQVRHLLRKIEQGRSPECESRAAVGEEWGVLKTGCVNGGIYRFAEHKALPAHISPHSEYEVKEGDLLMSRASGSKDLIGAVAYVEKTPSRLLLSDKVFRLKLEPGVHPQNFTLLMGSQHVRAQIELAINGAEGLANNITKESIKSFVVALPAYEEQQDIFTHLSMQSHRFAKLSEQLLAALDVLKERRSALISAAVTGKIDVRNWRPPADESAFDAEVRQAGLETTV
jgi:type I restriction enzyme S subunit